MLKLLLWFRYLRQKKMVLLSIGAVALSVALLVVVDSLFVGFISGLEEADIRGAGDLLLAPALAENYDGLIDRIEELDEVRMAGPLLAGGGLLHLGHSTGDVREAIVFGVDSARESKDGDLSGSLIRQGGSRVLANFAVPGYEDEVGAWVGIGLLAEPNDSTDKYDLEAVKKFIGTRMLLTTSGRVRVVSADGVTRWKMKRKVLKFRVSDIVHSGTYTRDNNLYLPYAKYYGLVFGDDHPARATNIKIRLRKGFDLYDARAAVWRVWEDFALDEPGLGEDAIPRGWIWVRSIQDEPFFAELRKQMSVLLMIFGVICSVTVLLIFCIFYMIVITKQKDIAIIKSCGMGSVSSGLIFLGFGTFVGLVGSAVGVLLGYLITFNINTIENWVRVLLGIKLWRSSVYIFEKIPNEVHWGSLWWIVLAAVAACVVGSLIPAIVAARLEPVKILRYE